MIRYRLTCQNDHAFDSWFRNAEVFLAQQSAGQIACPVCGTAQVEKALMAPAVRPARTAEARGTAPDSAAPEGDRAAPNLRDPQTALEAAMAELRRQIEANSDYVGMNFATEARKMHAGEAPARPIHGEARPEEARQMIEDGLPVAPLPFLPARKVN